MPSEKIVALLLDEDRRGLESAARLSREIALAAEWIADSFTGGGTVLFAGAGTSGRLGVLEAAECPPTFGTDPDRIRAVIAGGTQAVFEAREGAEDRAEDGRSAAETLGVGDLLIGISASSVTPFARGALDQARAGGARTRLGPRTGVPAVAKGDGVDTPSTTAGATRISRVAGLASGRAVPALQSASV